MTVADVQQYSDNGTKNIIKGIRRFTNTPYEIVDNVSMKPVGLAVFDSVGTLIESYNCSSVIINAAGDVSINWATSDIDSDSRVLIQSYSNPSGHPFVTNIFTHSATTTRFFTYNLNGGVPTQQTATKYIVEIY